ncbi:MAG: flavodoxin [Thermoplasmata archaeon]
MKTLVVYYSRTGNTEKVGRALAKHLEADTERIIDKKNRKTPLIGFIRAGYHALKEKETEIGGIKHDPSMYDLVIIGTPVWAGSITPAVRTYLNRYGNKLPEVVFYCTSGGGELEKVYRQLKECSGKSPIYTFGIEDKKIKENEHRSKIAGIVEKIRSSMKYQK